MRQIHRTSGLCLALLLTVACKDEQTRAAEAAAKTVAAARLLGPNDLQIISMDGTVGLEVVGDSVHVYLPNSVMSVPATHIQNVKYADSRLRFDIDGIGMRIFEVGDGSEGAAFTQADALLFVGAVAQKQAEMGAR